MFFFLRNEISGYPICMLQIRKYVGLKAALVDSK